MKVLIPILIGLLPLLGLAESKKSTKPNIIFFISDDQNKEQIGCYGGKVLTPHLDRLAREGMRMDNAHVIATVCTLLAIPCSRAVTLVIHISNHLEEFPKNRHGAPGFNVGLEEDNMNVGNVTPFGLCDWSCWQIAR